MEYKDTFDNELWKLGEQNPHLREAIAQIITSPTEYSIPTRELSSLTGELEDITILVQEIEDPKKRERVKTELELLQNTTVKDLAKQLGVCHALYTAKELKGKELTPQEKTLKDLDIIALAYTLRLVPVAEAMNKLAKKYNSGADFEADRERITDKAEEDKKKFIDCTEEGR